MAERTDIIGQALFALTRLAVRQRGRELSLTAVSALATLARTGPRRLTDLAVNEGVTQPSMTAGVAQLEDLGVAERRRPPGGGRAVRVANTPAGAPDPRPLRGPGAMVFPARADT